MDDLLLCMWKEAKRKSLAGSYEVDLKSVNCSTIVACIICCLVCV